MNPHMIMTTLDPPGDGNKRQWTCDYCGDAGLMDEVRSRACSYVYPPCDTCGQTPECARDCGAILSALSPPGLYVIGGGPDEDPI